MKYDFILNVTGRGTFPFDQLRRYAMYPTDTVAAEKLGDTDRRSINLSMDGQNYATLDACKDRFESFGWKVDIDDELQVRATTAQEIIDLMNRHVTIASRKQCAAAKIGDERGADKATGQQQLIKHLLGRITANNCGIRSINAPGD